MSRFVAVAGIILGGAGLGATVASEARLWGPEAAGISQANRWWLVPILVAPHAVAVVSAVTARSSLLCSLPVLLGASANAWMSVAVWANDDLNRTERVLALMYVWIIQGLLCSPVIAGGITGWQTRRMTVDHLPNHDRIGEHLSGTGA